MLHLRRWCYCCNLQCPWELFLPTIITKRFNHTQSDQKHPLLYHNRQLSKNILVISHPWTDCHQAKRTRSLLMFSLLEQRVLNKTTITAWAMNGQHHCCTRKYILSLLFLLIAFHQYLDMSLSCWSIACPLYWSFTVLSYSGCCAAW